MNTNLNVAIAPKDSTFQVRINSEIKRAVEEIYAKTGMTLTDAFNTFIQQSLNVEGLPFIVTKNSKEALREQAVAMLMLDLKRAEERADTEGWIDADDLEKELGVHMSTRNSCNTYFKIVGNFNPDEISELLNLAPERTWKIGDLRRNGTMYDFALWEIGRCTEYDVEVENQMRKTIAILQDKIQILNQIRKDYDVNFVLEIVPSIYVGDTNPCLAPPLDVIDFCHATRTEIDIDLYVYDSEE